MKPEDLAKWLNLSVIFSLTLMGMCMVPFFAPVAKERFFLRPSFIGYVFAGFPVGYVLSSILITFCNIAHFSTPTINVVIRISVTIDIVVSLLFGAIPFMMTFEDNLASELTTMFVLMFLRVMMGCATAVLDTAVLLFLVRLFPDKMSEMVGLNEALAGLGLLFGPPIGGALYDVGGYFLPFAVCCGISFVFVVVSGILILKSESIQDLFAERHANYKKEAGHRTVTPKHLKVLAKAPLHLVVGPSLLSAFGFSAYTMLESMAPLHYKQQWELSPGVIGAAIGGASVVYAVLAIVIGKLIGKPSIKRRRPLLLACGPLCIGLATFLAAPSLPTVLGHEISIATGRGVGLLGMISLGAALPLMTVVGQSIVVDAAKGKGDKLVPAAGAIGNLMTSAGAFTGPVVGSHLVQAYGFSDAFFYYTCASVVVAFLYLMCFIADSARGLDVQHISDLPQFAEVVETLPGDEEEGNSSWHKGGDDPSESTAFLSADNEKGYHPRVQTVQ